MGETKFKCREYVKESANYRNIIYHRECYQDATNRTNLQRLEVRFQNKAHEVTSDELKKKHPKQRGQIIKIELNVLWSFRNIGEFGARKYFTDHQIANAIQLFAAKKVN